MKDEQLLDELGKEENWRTMTDKEVLAQARKDERQAVINDIADLLDNTRIYRNDPAQTYNLIDDFVLAQLEKE